jgi:hypothetical protein
LRFYEDIGVLKLESEWEVLCADSSALAARMGFEWDIEKVFWRWKVELTLDHVHCWAVAA